MEPRQTKSLDFKELNKAQKLINKANDTFTHSDGYISNFIKAYSEYVIAKNSLDKFDLTDQAKNYLNLFCDVSMLQCQFKAGALSIAELKKQLKELTSTVYYQTIKKDMDKFQKKSKGAFEIDAFLNVSPIQEMEQKLVEVVEQVTKELKLNDNDSYLIGHINFIIETMNEELPADGLKMLAFDTNNFDKTQENLLALIRDLNAKKQELNQSQLEGLIKLIELTADRYFDAAETALEQDKKVASYKEAMRLYQSTYELVTLCYKKKEERNEELAKFYSTNCQIFEQLITCDAKNAGTYIAKALEEVKKFPDGTVLSEDKDSHIKFLKEQQKSVGNLKTAEKETNVISATKAPISIIKKKQRVIGEDDITPEKQEQKSQPVQEEQSKKTAPSTCTAVKAKKVSLNKPVTLQQTNNSVLPVQEPTKFTKEKKVNEVVPVTTKKEINCANPLDSILRTIESEKKELKKTPVPTSKFIVPPGQKFTQFSRATGDGILPTPPSFGVQQPSKKRPENPTISQERSTKVRRREFQTQVLPQLEDPITTVLLEVCRKIITNEYHPTLKTFLKADQMKDHADNILVTLQRLINQLMPGAMSVTMDNIDQIDVNLGTYPQYEKLKTEFKTEMDKFLEITQRQVQRYF